MKPIAAGYVVHHINKNRADNRIENLDCMANDAHARMHRTGWRKCKAGKEER